MVEENKKNLSSTTLSENDKKEIVSRTWGADATLDGTTVKDLTGQVLAEDIDENTLKTLEANYLATQNFKASGESVLGMVEIVKRFSNDDYISDTAIEALFSNKEGTNLTQEDLKQLSVMDDKAKWIYWENLTDEQKDLFGSGQDFIDYIDKAIKTGENGFKTSKKTLYSKNITSSEETFS
jgi:hypothetical protein